MIFYNRQNVKNKSFLDLGSRNCANAVRLFTSTASNLDFLKRVKWIKCCQVKSDFGSRDVVWLWQTFLSKSRIFSCVWHILQRLRHSLRFDKWLWLPSDVSCDVRSGVRRHEERQPPSVLLPSLILIFCRFRSSFFGQFLRLGHNPPVDKRTGLREIDLSDYRWLKIFWLA